MWRNPIVSSFDHYQSRQPDCLRSPPKTDSNAASQIRLGKRLAREKAKCFAEGRIWKAYVTSTYDFSRERADELIRIGLGLLSVEEARAEKKRRTQVYRVGMREARIQDLVLMQSRRSHALSQLVVDRMKRHDFPSVERAEIERAVRNAIATWQGLLDEVTFHGRL